MAAAAALGLLLRRWGVLTAAQSHPAALAGLSLILLLRTCLHRRQVLQRAVERSWVAALPSSASLPERIALVPLALSFGVTAISFLGDPCWPAFECAAAVQGGACVGVLLAVLLPQRALGSAPQPRTVWLNRPLAGTRASLLPLAHWPVGRKQTWARPQVLALGSFVILMGIPMTESQGGFARTAIGTVAVWFVGHHLVTLLLALLRTAFPAARWLAPTPLGGFAFAVFLGYRIWLKEAVAGFLLLCAATVVAPTLSASAGSLIVLAWLAACVVLGVAACHIARLTHVLSSPLHRWMR
jgi:hypothetical protein